MSKSLLSVLEIEGQRFELTPAEWENLDCISPDDHHYHLLVQGKTHNITVLDFDLATRRCTLKVDGEIKKVQFLRDVDLLIEKMGLNIMQSRKQTILNAPMPGLVMDIKVTPGQEVEKGSPLMILEAMKMENVITAANNSRIKEIKVSVGQAVEKGSALIEFDHP